MTSELEISPALTILAPNGSLRSLELLAVVRACMVQIEGQWTQDQDSIPVMYRNSIVEFLT